MDRAVDKRANKLNSEYLTKARHTDQAYCRTPKGTIGPVELKLGSLGRVHGIVVGTFGEASDDLQSLLHHLAVQCEESDMLDPKWVGGAR